MYKSLASVTVTDTGRTAVCLALPRRCTHSSLPAGSEMRVREAAGRVSTV